MEETKKGAKLALLNLLAHDAISIFDGQKLSDPIIKSKTWGKRYFYFFYYYVLGKNKWKKYDTYTYNREYNLFFKNIVTKEIEEKRNGNDIFLKYKVLKISHTQ